MPIRLLVGPESGSAHLMIFFRLILCAEILRTIKGFVNFCYSLLVNDFISVRRATFLVSDPGCQHLADLNLKTPISFNSFCDSNLHVTCTEETQLKIIDFSIENIKILKV